MTLLHIPVRVAAADAAEIQGFTDVLSGGQAGALALAGAGERPLVTLVCPSGDAGAVEGPAVLLGHGDKTGDMGAHVRGLPIPARLSDVLEALEALASAASGFTTPRDHGAWRLEPARLSLRTPDGRSVALTDTEARLLACLFDSKGDEVSRDTLLQRVWGYRPGLDTHTLETHIYRLRRKLEADPGLPALIVTTDSGYRFSA